MSSTNPAGFRDLTPNDLFLNALRRAIAEYDAWDGTDIDVLMRTLKDLDASLSTGGEPPLDWRSREISQQIATSHTIADLESEVHRLRRIIMTCGPLAEDGLAALRNGDTGVTDEHLVRINAHLAGGAHWGGK